ncbi:hypothetical protein ACMTAS_0655 [Thermotoga neapolitana DSM 4359]
MKIVKKIARRKFDFVCFKNSPENAPRGHGKVQRVLRSCVHQYTIFGT